MLRSLLLLAAVFPLWVEAAAYRRTFTHTSTSSYTTVDNVNAAIRYDGVVVQNLTDGNVEIAFGDDTFPDIVVPENTDIALDQFPVQGEISVRNSTGTGGAVLITLWKAP